MGLFKLVFGGILLEWNLQHYKGPVVGGKGLWYLKNRTLRVLVTTMGPHWADLQTCPILGPRHCSRNPQSEQDYRRGIGRLGFM